MPNYRGSTGHGVEYSKGDHNGLMDEQMHDDLTGIDHLIQLGMVDENRAGRGLLRCARNDTIKLILNEYAIERKQ